MHADPRPSPTVPPELVLAPGLTLRRTVLTLIAVAGIGGATVHRLALDCSRDARECVVIEGNLFTTASDRLPLDGLSSVKLKRGKGSKSPVSVVLVTAAGEHAAVSDPSRWTMAEKEAVAEGVTAFLGSNDPELHATLGDAQGVVPFLMVVALLMLLSGSLMKVVVRVDPRRKTLTFRRSFFGRGGQTQDFDLRQAQLARLLPKKLTAWPGVEIAMADGSAIAVQAVFLKKPGREDCVALARKLDSLLETFAENHLNPPTVDPALAGALPLPGDLPVVTILHRGIRPVHAAIAAGLLLGIALVGGEAGQICSLIGALLFFASVAPFIPMRRFRFYSEGPQLVAETKYLGLIPVHRGTVDLRQAHRAALDKISASSSAVVIQLNDGTKVPLTMYSNVNFGEDELLVEVQAALDRTRDAARARREKEEGGEGAAPR